METKTKHQIPNSDKAIQNWTKDQSDNDLKLALSQDVGPFIRRVVDAELTARESRVDQ